MGKSKKFKGIRSDGKSRAERRAEARSSAPADVSTRQNADFANHAPGEQRTGTFSGSYTPPLDDQVDEKGHIERLQPLRGDEYDDREASLQKDVMLVATCGLSLMSGMPFSPVLYMSQLLLTPFVAGTILGSPIVMTYLASMLVSAFTLILAGVPAALYERAKGLKDSSPMSLGIWLLATCALVVLPHLVFGRG